MPTHDPPSDPSPLSDPRDYVVELSSPQDPSAPNAASRSGAVAPDNSAPAGRPFLSVHFKCCNAYTRIYPTSDRKAYAGHCPRCAKPVRIKIGPDGSANRLFTAE
jgi:hypothetical protein